jgi:ElaB/YqjD/DUF883 family membrane-anchored ribosome-binding protein
MRIERTTAPHKLTSKQIEGEFTAACRISGEHANGEGETMSENIFDKLEMPATVDDVLREVSKIRTAVTEAVDDGVKSAVRTLRQGRDAAEDAIDDARRTVKKNPLQSVGVVFVVGVLVGCVLSLVGRRQ